MSSTICTYPDELLPSIAIFRRFTAAIDAINERLEQYAAGRKQVTYLDCSQGFVEDNPKVSLLSLGMCTSAWYASSCPLCLERGVKATYLSSHISCEQ